MQVTEVITTPRNEKPCKFEATSIKHVPKSKESKSGVKLYPFLVGTTDSKFNAVILKLLFMSKRLLKLGLRRMLDFKCSLALLRGLKNGCKVVNTLVLVQHLECFTSTYSIKGKEVREG
ncbi:hypothetical protein CXB51_035847 [Gossypium anomalum]|uniref:Large ribosomal subunit protein uL15/eL18 domain-containing protein n=1 Tax=Gossypium anomalum TaxID=47600 RepID=A0A8J5Y8F9_9ROSI|nr:hypothetical protein CXB51_035847 [Gossypium anomalum]